MGYRGQGVLEFVAARHFPGGAHSEAGGGDAPGVAGDARAHGESVGAAGGPGEPAAGSSGAGAHWMSRWDSFFGEKCLVGSATRRDFVGWGPLSRPGRRSCCPRGPVCCGSGFFLGAALFFLLSFLSAQLGFSLGERSLFLSGANGGKFKPAENFRGKLSLAVDSSAKCDIFSGPKNFSQKHFFPL